MHNLKIKIRCWCKFNLDMWCSVIWHKFVSLIRICFFPLLKQQYIIWVIKVKVKYLFISRHVGCTLTYRWSSRNKRFICIWWFLFWHGRTQCKLSIWDDMASCCTYGKPIKWWAQSSWLLWYITFILGLTKNIDFIFSI